MIASAVRTGKYHALSEYLCARRSKGVVTLRFKEVEQIIQAKLPPSATRYPEWWANQTNTDNRPQAYAWMSQGFRVQSVVQADGTGWVEFVKA